jgi:hypothetical protein
VDIELKSGDIIIDIETKESGLLVKRYNIFDHIDSPIYSPITAWEILWAGQSVRGGALQAFTEESILNMIRSGAMVLIQNN